jgi:hypothetical protein
VSPQTFANSGLDTRQLLLTSAISNKNGVNHHHVIKADISDKYRICQMQQLLSTYIPIRRAYGWTMPVDQLSTMCHILSGQICTIATVKPKDYTLPSVSSFEWVNIDNIEHDSKVYDILTSYNNCSNIVCNGMMYVPISCLVKCIDTSTMGTIDHTTETMRNKPVDDAREIIESVPIEKMNINEKSKENYRNVPRWNSSPKSQIGYTEQSKSPGKQHPKSKGSITSPVTIISETENIPIASHQLQQHSSTADGCRSQLDCSSDSLHCYDYERQNSSPPSGGDECLPDIDALIGEIRKDIGNVDSSKISDQVSCNDQAVEDTSSCELSNSRPDSAVKTSTSSIGGPSKVKDECNNNVNEGDGCIDEDFINCREIMRICDIVDDMIVDDSLVKAPDTLNTTSTTTKGKVISLELLIDRIPNSTVNTASNVNYYERNCEELTNTAKKHKIFSQMLYKKLNIANATNKQIGGTCDNIDTPEHQSQPKERIKQFTFEIDSRDINIMNTVTNENKLKEFNNKQNIKHIKQKKRQDRRNRDNDISMSSRYEMALL